MGVSPITHQEADICVHACDYLRFALLEIDGRSRLVVSGQSRLQLALQVVD